MVEGVNNVLAVQIGILTIRDDEFKAVLNAFPDHPNTHRGRHREYALRSAEAGNGQRYRIAILKQIEQGNGEAQEAARDFIDDLQPTLLLVVGIAGGLPSDDITLGDVVISTRIVDFSVEARKFEEQTTYGIGGGPIAKGISAGLANLAAREKDLGDWTSSLPSRPAVTFSPKSFYGNAVWKKSVKSSLEKHFDDYQPTRAPHFMAGPIGSSDRLVKDPDVLVPILATSRNLLAVEMESAGVYRAARDKTPMLAIRGLSDIVGYKRNDAWTKYACDSAACFARAYLRTTPVEPQKADLSIDAGPTSRTGDAEHEEAFANLLPLRHFPERLYVSPAMCRTFKKAWEILRRPGTSQHVSPWTLYEGNVYSFDNPEHCALRQIADVGGVEDFDSKEWAYSDDVLKRRLFVYLLNACLKEDLWSLGVRSHGDQDVYAFMPSKERNEPRRVRYQNLKVRSLLTVVKNYPQTGKDGKKYDLYRHNAFQGRFRYLNNQYFLEITPTYRFTYDGKQLHRFHGQKLSGIKRLERNRSVLSQLLLWQATVRAPWPRGDVARLLDFAPLLSFTFKTAVDEGALTALDPPSVKLPTDEEIET